MELKLLELKKSYISTPTVAPLVQHECHSCQLLPFPNPRTTCFIPAPSQTPTKQILSTPSLAPLQPAYSPLIATTLPEENEPEPVQQEPEPDLQVHEQEKQEP